MLGCELPEELKPDERRRVFRVTPHPDTNIVIMPLYDAQESQSAAIDAKMKDVCVLGAGFASRDASVSERLRQGRFVLCRVDLPQEWGPAEAPAVVRYIRASVVANRPEYRVGVTFLSGPLWKQYQQGLDTIHRYVYTRPIEGRRRRDEPVEVPSAEDPGTDSSITLFCASFDRCRSKANFIRRFYERFLASSPEVERMFEGTNFVRQSRMIETALVLLASLRTDPGAVKKLGEIADRHGRHDLKVRPELYDLWVDNLLTTVEETDPEFTPAIETAWRTILAHGITFMKKRY